MLLKKFLYAAASAALVFGAAPAWATGVDRAEVEKIVREYLLANPEILNEMIAELQKHEEVASNQKAKSGIAANSDALYSDGYSFVAGNPNGDVTLIEFFDYRCGYCKKVRADVVKLLEEDKGVRLILKEFPILSAVSHEASKAALASLRQGGDHYWKFHQAMLSADSLDSGTIYEIAAEQGLDVARLKRDMEDPAIEEHLKKTHELAQSIGIDGTPAFIMGDKLAPGAIGLQDMKDMVAEQRSGG
jgi:protein-disulfide isomerase